jgi:hypothetical protein
MAMLARARLTKSFLMAQRTGTHVVVICGHFATAEVP